MQSLFDVTARVGVAGGRVRLMPAGLPNIAGAADPGGDSAHLSSTALHLSSHAAVRSNDGICSNRPSEENPQFQRQFPAGCGQTMNDDGLLSVWFNDENCPVNVRDAYFLRTVEMPSTVTESRSSIFTKREPTRHRKRPNKPWAEKKSHCVNTTDDTQDEG